MKKITALALMLLFAQTLFAGIVYIVNGDSETLSKYDTETGIVFNNILTLGEYANQIFICEDKGFVINSGEHNIQVIDLINENTIGFINCPNGSNPYWMTIRQLADGSKGYVTGLFTNKVYIFNPDNYIVTGSIDVGSGPEGLYFYEDKLYVCNTCYGSPNGTISVIDIDTDSVIETIQVGNNPQFCEVDANDKLHVVCTGNYADISGEVYIINIYDYTDYDVLEIGGSPTKIGIHNNGTVYLADGMGQGYMAYDSQTLNIIHPSTNLFASGGCFVRSAPDGNIYLGDALDWVNNGVVSIYSADEVLLNTITVGVIPQDAGFYNFDVAIDDDFPERDIFSLSNYPNPFSTSTTISFSLATDFHPSSAVPIKSGRRVDRFSQIKIYNIKGQLIRKLKIINYKLKINKVVWNRKDANGQKVSPGIYLYQAEIDGKKSKMKKMILLK
ncbi:MAG: T9SS type A sorting domain-containing protein [Candidatus Cloacimonadota bacterium]|nr:T9SS type A sorting domain-containing protein [Candidatus Cloacimonadota bacterium]